MTAEKLFIAGQFLIVLMPVVFVVQYIRLRLQNQRAARPDPELGRKSILHFFLTVSILTGLVGATVAAADLLTRAFEPLKQAQAAAGGATPVPVPWFNAVQRAAAALMLAGLMHGTLFAVLLRLGTNDRTAPAVRRAHAGVRLVVAGIFWMTADTAALLLVFAEGNTDWDHLATYSAVALVWGLASVVHLWMLMRGRKETAAGEDDESSGLK